MKPLSRVTSLVVPAVVIGAILFFVYYSLVIYQPTGTVACQKSEVSQQVDIAVNVVRQWFNRAGQMFSPCPTTSG